MSARRAGEERLRSLLRETPLPLDPAAEERGLAVVEAAFAARQPAPRQLLPRLALALALAALLAALLLSPAGAAVRHWVRDVLTAGSPNAAPGLTRIPGGGRLLVQAPAGAWVVHADGSRRLLGDYAEASWSPRGLFVAAASGRTLSAVEPGGTPHWSLSAPAAVHDPRWSPSGFQIAYRAGLQLRLVEATGEEDRPLDPAVRPVAPAWAPEGLPLLAYVDRAGRLRLLDTSTGRPSSVAPALPGARELEWSPDGTGLLEASRSALRLREMRSAKLMASMRLGAQREVRLPAGAALRDAAFSPDGSRVAALLSAGTPAGPRSEVLLIGVHGGPARSLLRVPGRLSQLAFSPDGSRLLLSWPEADQWLFVPADGRGRPRAVGAIAGQFAPGSRAAAFPRIDGWCCRPTVPLGG